MLSSKSKSGLPDPVNNKNGPASKIGRLGSLVLDADSPSPLKKPGFSIDFSPRSADLKPVANRRSPKSSTTPDKQSRALKGSELQAQLAAVLEDLRTAKEQLAFEEKEKTRVIEELSDVKKAVEEVSEKLAETLLAQKKAEESSELDKFRADELEQAAIEAAQKREKEWNKELEDIQNRHAADVKALLSVTEELQRAKHDLAMTIDAKNTALSHAEDAMKIAEVNAEKVEIFSGEITRLQSLLHSKLESKSMETAELIRKLGLEVEALKVELEEAKLAEEKLAQMETLAEGLKSELINAKKAESDAAVLVDEWKKKAELLESSLEEIKESESLAQDSLASLTKQVEESKSMLDDTESEIISLRGKVEALELEVASHEADHEKSEIQLTLAKQEALDLKNMVEVLKSEIRRAEEDRAQALNNTKLTTSTVENLNQENSKLAAELQITKEDSEKAKKAMEGLAAALHEVSLEARDVQERLLIKQAEVDSVAAEVDELKLTLKNTQEKYVVMLDEAKYEIVCLKKTIEKSETEAKDLMAEWDDKEINLRNAMKKADDEIVSIKLERDKAMETLEMKKCEVKAAEEEANKLHDKLRQAEYELFVASDAIEEVKAECRGFKEIILDKENELQNIFQENEELRVRDSAASEKIKELSETLLKVSSMEEEEGELCNSDKSYNTLQKMLEVRESKVDETETGNSEAPSEESQEVFKEGINNLEENGNENAEEWDLVKMKPKIFEGETMDKQSPTEMEHYAESIDDEDVQNGNTSPIKQRQLQKKKALLHRFGNLLKKKNSPK
ncbi:WEB family protein At3g02930, chloroplastic-like isoform X2 [Phalaenopsis equestris]|uniref:WEB family protein At3g02930, chloroplastic-like isoform X2 n=1 Tax=Phalaenopsis equestris TaxID=78828 RepID=UPI0009E4F7CD|nr:WEB family protein At3g02930, chloroplastic-like isoform X2 [Phalaenopsis equestris]